MTMEIVVKWEVQHERPRTFVSHVSRCDDHPLRLERQR